MRCPSPSCFFLVALSTHPSLPGLAWHDRGGVEGKGGEGRYIDSDIIIDEHHQSSIIIIIINTWRTGAYRFVLFFFGMFLASERNMGLGWKWSGLDWKWSGLKMEMEWTGKGKKDKSELGG